MPPQHPDEIVALMANLERFINEPELCDWDPLIHQDDAETQDLYRAQAQGWMHWALESCERPALANR